MRPTEKNKQKNIDELNKCFLSPEMNLFQNVFLSLELFSEIGNNLKPVFWWWAVLI